MSLEYPREMFARLAAAGVLKAPEHALDGAGLIVDTLFFASLMVEEGEPIQVGVVHHDDGAAGLALVTDDSPEAGEDPDLAWDVSAIPAQPFDAVTLAKLSRGVTYGTQLIVVGGKAKDYRIDGIARRRRRTDGGDVLRFAAPRPGVVVIERHLSQLLRYEAGQQGRRAFNVIGQTGPVRKALATINREAVSTTPSYPGDPTFYTYPELALHRLVQQMRKTESGAILALLPDPPSVDLLTTVRFRREDSTIVTRRVEEDWRRSIDWISSRIGTHDADISRDDARRQDTARHAADAAREDLDAAIEDVAQLSAIDGAVLGGPKLEIYGAGCVLNQVELKTEQVAALSISQPWTPSHIPTGTGLDIARRSASRTRTPGQ